MRPRRRRRHQHVRDGRIIRPRTLERVQFQVSESHLRRHSRQRIRDAKQTKRQSCRPERQVLGIQEFELRVQKKTLENLVPDRVSTEARSPLVIVVDGTGSMGEFPEVIFKKLPLLDLGIEDYLEDCEISFAMIGDAAGDKYALQVQNFTKGKGLVESLNKLVIEKGGGGNECESYDLAAAYYARNCEMPKATKPVLIYVSDEGIYSTLNKDWAKDHAKVDIEKAIKTRELFDELKSKFSVYCIRKHYGGGVDGEQMTGSNLAIHKQWQEYVGADRIAILNDPNRIVDVIFGLVAHETGKKEFFEEEINFRQTPEQVAEVMKSMLTVGREDYKSTAKRTGKSVLLLPKSTTGVRK